MSTPATPSHALAATTNKNNRQVRTAPKRPLWELALFVLIGCLSPCVQGSQSVTLAWGPDSDPSVAGYVLSYGETSGSYSNHIDVGTNTTATVTGLTEGTTNYFVVTAYNVIGIQGPPSSQIAYIVPGVIRVAKGPAGGSPMTISFPVAPGHWYQVQVSTDLKSWTTILQTTTAAANTWTTFQDTQSKGVSRRFYRLVLH
jgi:Fibronectin type III domain